MFHKIIYLKIYNYNQYIVSVPQEIQGCCCINPGRLTKGQTGSTYARILVQTDQLQDCKPISQHITAQIVRI